MSSYALTHACDPAIATTYSYFCLRACVGHLHNTYIYHIIPTIRNLPNKIQICKIYLSVVKFWLFYRKSQNYVYEKREYNDAWQK